MSRGFHFFTSDFVEEPVFADEILSQVWGNFTFETGEIVPLGGFFDCAAERFLRSLRNRKGSYLNIISAGFALELFWFLATGNTDFLFSFL